MALTLSPTDPLAFRRDAKVQGVSYVRGQAFAWQEAGVAPALVERMVATHILGPREAVQAAFGPAVEVSAEVAVAVKVAAEPPPKPATQVTRPTPPRRRRG